MKEMWDSRYSREEYAYGIAPNEFFKETIGKYNLGGSMLLPAEGEGRNAVFAAKNGLLVTAFDISIEGRNKALKLADEENVKINYEVGDFFDLDISQKLYDSVALIFAHFPPSLLSKYHKKIASLVKPGGMVILEGFSKAHLKFQKENPKVGGPNKIDMLFSTESIQKDFSDFKIIKLEEVIVELKEGNFHNGMSNVIRFIGEKK